VPWHVAKSGKCPASKPWAVIKDSDGSVEGCHASKKKAQDQLAALYANEEKSMSDKNTPKQEAAEREVRTFPFVVEDVRDAEGGRSKDFTIKGHAAVFNTWTDLGLFKERIAKGAFDEVLARDPHVLHLWDHSTRHVLSTTRNKTLELRPDPAGLHMWSRVAPTTYAADLRVLMERKDIDQSSFAFSVPDDGQTWKENEDGTIERTITKIGELYDVTTTAMGAYPTTDSQVAMATRARARAIAEGLPEPPPAETPDDAAPETVADEGTETPPEDRADSEEDTVAQDADSAARDRAALLTLKEAARKRLQKAKDAQELVTKEFPKRWETGK
jgi:HK97 family phage prohead protease